MKRFLTIKLGSDVVEMYNRICQCNRVINYSSRKKYLRACKNNTKCRSCGVKQDWIENGYLYNERKNKISNTLKKHFSNLSIEEKQKLLKPWIEAGSKTTSVGNVSKLESELVEFLEIIGFKHNKLSIGINGFYPDFIDDLNKIILEINGDYWHANPSKYNSDWIHPVRKLTAKEIWNLDRKRLQSFSEAGYKTIVVWEKEIKRKSKDVRLGIIKSKLKEN